MRGDHLNMLPAAAGVNIRLVVVAEKAQELTDTDIRVVRSICWVTLGIVAIAPDPTRELTALPIPLACGERTNCLSPRTPPASAFRISLPPPRNAPENKP